MVFHAWGRQRRNARHSNELRAFFFSNAPFSAILLTRLRPGGARGRDAPERADGLAATGDARQPRQPYEWLRLPPQGDPANDDRP